MSGVCLSPPTQSKIRLYIHLRLLLLLQIIEGGGYGFGDNIRDVPFRKVISGPLPVGFQAIVHEMSDLLAVVALLSFGSCLLQVDVHRSGGI